MTNPDETLDKPPTYARYCPHDLDQPYRRGDRIKLADRWYGVTRTSGDRVWYSHTGIAGQSADRLAADLTPLVRAHRRNGAAVR